MDNPQDDIMFHTTTTRGERAANKMVSLLCNFHCILHAVDVIVLYTKGIFMVMDEVFNNP